jgi:hypothetical protein
MRLSRARDSARLGVLVTKRAWSHTMVAEQLREGELPPGWQQMVEQWRQAHPAAEPPAMNDPNDDGPADLGLDPPPRTPA